MTLPARSRCRCTRVNVHNRVAPVLPLFRPAQRLVEAFVGTVETTERERRAGERSDHDRAFVEEQRHEREGLETERTNGKRSRDAESARATLRRQRRRAAIM